MGSKLFEHADFRAYSEEVSAALGRAAEASGLTPREAAALGRAVASAGTAQDAQKEFLERGPCSWLYGEGGLGRAGADAFSRFPGEIASLGDGLLGRCGIGPDDARALSAAVSALPQGSNPVENAAAMMAVSAISWKLQSVYVPYSMRMSRAQRRIFDRYAAEDGRLAEAARMQAQSETRDGEDADGADDGLLARSEADDMVAADGAGVSVEPPERVSHDVPGPVAEAEAAPGSGADAASRRAPAGDASAEPGTVPDAGPEPEDADGGERNRMPSDEPAPATDAAPDGTGRMRDGCGGEMPAGIGPASPFASGGQVPGGSGGVDESGGDVCGEPAGDGVSEPATVSCRAVSGFAAARAGNAETRRGRAYACEGAGTRPALAAGAIFATGIAMLLRKGRR